MGSVHPASVGSNSIDLENVKLHHQRQLLKIVSNLTPMAIVSNVLLVSTSMAKEFAFKKTQIAKTSMKF